MEEKLLSPYELFGVECGEGWHELLKPVFDYIENYNKDKSDENKIIVEQVKEKFGTLRFYCSFYTDELEKLIEEAENKSDVTCESCGSTKDVGKTGGWIRTICKKCVEDMAKDSKYPIVWFFNGEKIIFKEKKS